MVVCARGVLAALCLFVLMGEMNWQHLSYELGRSVELAERFKGRRLYIVRGSGVNEVKHHAFFRNVIQYQKLEEQARREGARIEFPSDAERYAHDAEDELMNHLWQGSRGRGNYPRERVLVFDKWGHLLLSKQGRRNSIVINHQEAEKLWRGGAHILTHSHPPDIPNLPLPLHDPPTLSDSRAAAGLNIPHLRVVTPFYRYHVSFPHEHEDWNMDTWEKHILPAARIHGYDPERPETERNLFTSHHQLWHNLSRLVPGMRYHVERTNPLGARR